VSDTIFVIGGCRSGKSRYALKTAQKFAGHKKIFLATCIPDDDEMKQRVARHQDERGSDWETAEVPIDLPHAIKTQSQTADILLVDCLTLWISNLIMKCQDPAIVETHINSLKKTIAKAHCPVILVSNEVGTGIVPQNKLARLFRDLVGFVNQTAAECADRVVWMVAGIPVTIKKREK